MCGILRSFKIYVQGVSKCAIKCHKIVLMHKCCTFSIKKILTYDRRLFVRIYSFNSLIDDWNCQNLPSTFLDSFLLVIGFYFFKCLLFSLSSLLSYQLFGHAAYKFFDYFSVATYVQPNILGMLNTVMTHNGA